MKKVYFFIIILALVLMMTLLSSPVLADNEEIWGYYIGTFTIKNIYIDNINASIKSMGFSGIIYEADFDDYASSNTAMRINDDKINLSIGIMEAPAESFEYSGSTLTINLAPGRYGYIDEGDVRYVLTGTLANGKYTGTFQGIIVATGLVETDGVFSLDLNNRFGPMAEEPILPGLGSAPAEEEKHIPVTDILFEKIEMELMVGDEVKTKVAVFPKEATNRYVRYAISDPNIARVSLEGVIYAKMPGQVTITAYADDNPDHFDRLLISVYYDGDVLNDEELAKAQLGMAIFEGRPSEKGVGAENSGHVAEVRADLEANFTNFSPENLDKDAQARLEEFNDMLALVGKNDDSEFWQDDEPVETFYDYIKAGKKLLRYFKKPVDDKIAEIVKKIPKVAGSDVFQEYVKDQVSSFIAGIDDRRKKNEDEIKDQLQGVFSVDQDGFALSYLKGKLEDNSFVKLFASPINKIFGAKQTQFKEAVYTEYKSVRDAIMRNVEAGMTLEKAIDKARRDFIYNDNFDNTLDALDNAKPGMERFFAMRQGGKENQVVTGSKLEFQSNQNRFDKYLELFDLNMEFEGVR